LTCGSKWHPTENCPANTQSRNDDGKNNSKGKSQHHYGTKEGEKVNTFSTRNSFMTTNDHNSDSSDSWNIITTTPPTRAHRQSSSSTSSDRRDWNIPDSFQLLSDSRTPRRHPPLPRLDIDTPPTPPTITTQCVQCQLPTTQQCDVCTQHVCTRCTAIHPCLHATTYQNIAYGSNPCTMCNTTSATDICDRCGQHPCHIHRQHLDICGIPQLLCSECTTHHQHEEAPGTATFIGISDDLPENITPPPLATTASTTSIPLQETTFPLLNTSTTTTRTQVPDFQDPRRTAAREQELLALPVTNTATSRTPPPGLPPLSFFTGVFSVASQFHTVKGRHLHGLIVDPGACDGIIGTHTLSRYAQDRLWPKNLDISTRPSVGTFSGINGEPKPGMGRATIPLGLPGFPGAVFEADMLGGMASECPGLLPNRTIMQYHMTLFAAVLPSDDGILMIVPNHPKTGEMLGNAYLYHIYKTDSNHYLLPTGNFDSSLDSQEQQYLFRAIDNYLCKTLYKQFSRKTTTTTRSTTSTPLHLLTGNNIQEEDHQDHQETTHPTQDHHHDHNTTNTTTTSAGSTATTTNTTKRVTFEE